MILVLSGEGPTDIGSMESPGPFARLVDRLIEQFQSFEYSHLLNGRCIFVHRSELKKHTKLPGKKSPQNTGLKRNYFFNAMEFAKKAKQFEIVEDDTSIGVFYHDADTTNAREYRDNKGTVIEGFRQAAYATGVAMMPKPAAEAWLLASLLGSHKCGGKVLENIADRDHLKDLLTAQLSGDSARELDIMPDSIPENMSSYEHFKTDLKTAFQMVS